MPTTLMVPLDGSAFAEDALPPAVELARRAGATVHLVRVHTPPVLPSPDTPIVADARWVMSMREEEARYLDDAAERFLVPAGVPYETQLVDGLTAESLAGYAAREGVDLIVMTTHGRGGFSRFWLGSVADLLVRHGHTPVLLYRPRDRSGGEAVKPQIRHILLPTDGSALSFSVLDAALDLGRPTGARYTMLRVVSPTPPTAVYGLAPAIELSAEDRARLLADLEATAGRVRARGVEVEAAIEVSRASAPAILDYAARHAVDAIALATHGRGPLTRAAMGSVADKVMRGAAVPVLLYRPTTVGREPAASTGLGEEASIHAGT